MGLVEGVSMGNGSGGRGAEGDPGTLNKRLVRGPAVEPGALRMAVPVGLGLRLLRLQLGLAKPLPAGRNGRS